MTNKLRALSLSLLISLFFTSGFVAGKTQNYLMWQIPGTGGVTLPVYVYQNQAQVAYIPSISLQVFAGVYDPTSTTATFDLYYQAGSTWYGCTLTLLNGSINASKTNCPGAVINSPTNQNGANSNVYTVGFGATTWPSVPGSPKNPTKDSYSNRTITFKNNTNYPMIQIGESCDLSNSKNSAPSCQNKPIVATISKTAPYVVTVGVDGLDSSAFYLTSFCTAASESACGTPPVHADCEGSAPKPPANWVCTGGYFAGQTPYATKIEPTILTVTGGVPAGASNIDVSAVDGFSKGVKLYPSPAAYCTYTVPPENSNVLGAGYYDASSPLAQLVPTSSTSLETQCAASSQLPVGGTGTAWNLSKTSASGTFEGCMSPCAYANATLGSGSTVDQFCCQGQYNTPATCDVAAGQVGANTSTYNKNIESSAQFQNVYGFAYGDAGSDYGCPPETNFVVEFVSG